MPKNKIVYIYESIHKELKVKAAKRDLTIGELIISLNEMDDLKKKHDS